MTGKKPKGGAGSMPSTYASSGSASRAGRNRPAMGPAQEKLAPLASPRARVLAQRRGASGPSRGSRRTSTSSRSSGAWTAIRVSAPWTGDSASAWQGDPERCVRRFVAALEDRMRATVAAVEEAEPQVPVAAWRRRDLLNAVFSASTRNGTGSSPATATCRCSCARGAARRRLIHVASRRGSTWRTTTTTTTP